MTLGPVQLFVVGLENDKLRGEIAHQLTSATDKKFIRVLDALAVRREPDGSVVSLGTSDLSEDQRMVLGATIGGLIGLGRGGEQGMEEGAIRGAESFAEHNFGLSKKEIREMAHEIPIGTTVLMVLLEHLWAIKLKEALQDANGFVIADPMVRPEALVEIGARMPS